MVFKALDQLNSYINDSITAKDKNRVFTFIEFVKEFGYENSSDVFLNYYKEYLETWNNKKSSDIKETDENFVMTKMVDILKSITLDYSSYEEQDFIAHIDWSDKDQIRGLVSYYSKKIREITEFYRKKRNESHLIINRNSMKGSNKSVEEIIYNKIIDFTFNNRHIIPIYSNLRRDLMVSVENYVDTYSEYFDIPRNKDFTDRSRQEMLSANMNDVDYRNYLEISLVVSEILYSGNVHLEEIPLIAQLGIDLSQSCVGDMLALKDTLMNNTTINQIPLNEQVALKRKLYEKFLGCDLYYLYVDLQKNVKMDVLCRAKNPTGNLLNCGSVDTATIESEQLELLSHVGLFFKPDKTSILKISAKDYSWSVDETKLEEDTIYIFPDPNKYGDIGNNKNSAYPLIMEYKMDYDIRNLSSGDSSNDPLMLITDQGWRSYYSKQEDDFKLFDNVNYDYAFTSLANKGIIKSFQTDVWGNQFGLFKGYKEVFKKDENGNLIHDSSGNPILDKILIPSKFKQELSYIDNLYNTAHPMILNGGYFEDPYRKGKDFTRIEQHYKDREEDVILSLQDVILKNGEIIQTFVKDFVKTDAYNEKPFEEEGLIKIKGREYVPEIEIEKYIQEPSILERYYEKISTPITYRDGALPFDYTRKHTVNENYHWTGLSVYNDEFYIPNKIFNHINYGEFGRTRDIIYEDNYEVIKKGVSTLENKDDIIESVLDTFLSSVIKTDGSTNEVKYEYYEANIEDFRDEPGILYVRNISNIHNKPKKFADYFNWMPEIDDKKIINIQVIYETILIETEEKLYFIKYNYDGENFSNARNYKEIFTLDKTIYLSTNYYLLEKERSFYIAQLELNEEVRALNLHITKFDCINYTIKEIINFYDVVNKSIYESNKMDTIRLWSNFIKTKTEINKTNNLEELKKLLSGENEKYPNFGDLSIPYMLNYDLGKVSFTYNSSLRFFLISFIILDMNGSPFIFEIKFRASNNEVLHDTMVSNLYSIGGANKTYDVESRYMENILSQSISYPDKSLSDTIFEEIV